MGEKRPTFTKLYAPDGTLVEVEGEERATLLKEQRGYTTSKPRNPTKPAVQSNDAQAEIDRLTAENEALKAAAAKPADK
jgi:hypothetical protein